MVTQEQLDAFVADQQARHDAYCNRMGYVDINRATHEASIGKRYARIIRTDKGGIARSVVCFIDMTNGDILKAGGWKAPAKNGVRGNIFAQDRGASCMTQYGTAYLR